VQEFQLSREDQETLDEAGALDRFRHIEYAQVECKLPICANGVKLIDSPGLGEHISRTRVATNFLKQSEAVILVLNATRILTQDERMFVDTVLGQGRLTHVFFVVNRMDQVDEGEIEDIKAWVQQGLAPHFADQDGTFDRDLYSRRIFFTNAKGALDAHMEPALDRNRLEATGVPALEREMERFLTTDDKVSAVLQSTVQLLLPIVAQARRRIAQQRLALDQPLAELERRRDEASRQLQALESRKGEIERTILLFGQAMKRKVFADLRSYVDDMDVTWLEDSRQLVDLDGALSLKTLLASYVQPEAREELALAVSQQLQRYLQLKFDAWAQRIPTMLESDLERMVAEVEAQVDDFQLELDQIASGFAGAPVGAGARQDVMGGRVLQLALSLSDISSATGAVLDARDWGPAIGGMVQRAIVVLLISSLLPIISPLVAIVIVEAIHMGLRESDLKKRIRQALGDKLHESLQQQLQEKQPFIYDSLEHHFRQFAQTVTEVIGNQIDEVRTEQTRIVRQKQDEQFSVEDEKQRLHFIEDKLVETLDTLSAEAYGRRLDLAPVGE
jgi:hypothetical protein